MTVFNGYDNSLDVVSRWENLGYLKGIDNIYDKKYLADLYDGLKSYIESDDELTSIGCSEDALMLALREEYKSNKTIIVSEFVDAVKNQSIVLSQN